MLRRRREQDRKTERGEREREGERDIEAKKMQWARNKDRNLQCNIAAKADCQMFVSCGKEAFTCDEFGVGSSPDTQEGPREEFSLCSGLPLCEQDVRLMC